MIRTPPGWGIEMLGQAMRTWPAPEAWDHATAEAPVVRRIGTRAIGNALRLGWQDFVSVRSDVLFLCLLYPIAGLVMARIALGHDMLHLLFPLASGFALLGPVFAVGLNEISRRREQGAEATWTAAFGIVRSPSFGAIVLLGLVLTILFLFWMLLAQLIYVLTLGPHAPPSVGVFVRQVAFTPAGRLMAVTGIGLGFVIACCAFAVSVVSFPLLLDRPVSLETAVLTSWRVVARNPGPMALWAVILAGGLIVGSVPALIGLVVVFPVLGHATWHLYREVVRR